MSEISTHFRNCNICEAMCGIEIQYKDNEILSIKGDKNDPLSRGHICPKAVALQDFHNDKDRLQHPMKRTINGWVEISWEEAMEEIVSNIQKIQSDFGKNAFASYLGNPNAHNFGNLMFFPMFFKALGTFNRYSSASADQLPHHVASNFMLGDGMLMPIPDIDRTDFLLIIGGNPLVSNGSLMTAPDFPTRMKAIQKRGGKVVVIDPRKTETADKANEHLFIRPEKDALFLLAIIHTIFDEKFVKLGHLEDIIDGIEEIEALAKDFSPEKLGKSIGITAKKIRKLALEFANAPSAICYSRMGASTQTFGGLCLWLTNVLNIITGNFDREGGAMFTQAAFDYVMLNAQKGKINSYGRFQSRVEKLPFYNSEFPVSTLANEILTEGEGQIKGLILVAGNPVLSSPNGQKLEKAFENLDFMVAIDIYLNESNRFANIILPATTGLENSHYDIIFHTFAIRNTAKYSPKLFEPKGKQREDWQILKEIALRLTGQEDNGLTPEIMLDAVLKQKGLSIKMLLENPHGLDLGELKTCLKERLQTENGRINLAPTLFLSDIPRLNAVLEAKKDKKYPFDMIGRRLLRTHNTWTHNSYRLVKGNNDCTLMINPKDAQKLGLENGKMAKVESKTGKIEIEVEITDELMQGVVSIPQGWGSRKNTNMTVASTLKGVSINDLTDEKRIDNLTGNAAFNGVKVRVFA